MIRSLDIFNEVKKQRSGRSRRAFLVCPAAGAWRLGYKRLPSGARVRGGTKFALLHPFFNPCRVVVACEFGEGEGRKVTQRVGAASTTRPRLHRIAAAQSLPAPRHHTKGTDGYISSSVTARKTSPPRLRTATSRSIFGFDLPVQKSKLQHQSTYRVNGDSRSVPFDQVEPHDERDGADRGPVALLKREVTSRDATYGSVPSGERRA